MRRAQSLFLPIFTLGVIIMFIGVILTGILKAGEFEGEKPVIGEKQQHVLNAYDEARSMQSYVQRAADRAADKASREPNLDRSIQEDALETFNEIIRQYPLQPIQTQFNAEVRGGEIVFTATQPVHIPVGPAQTTRRALAYSIGTGILTTWPSDELVITSLFSERRFVSGSRFHAGIDIRARPFGEPVYAVGTGTATPNNPIQNAVSLRMNNGWTCEYLHVEPLQQTTYTVSEGDVIARVTNDGYDAHLDLRCYNHETPLNRQQAVTLFGARHVATASLAASDTMLVNVREERQVTYVDPYCLFSEELRQLITYNPNLDGWDFRQGATQQEKEVQTCQAYVQAELLSQDTGQIPQTSLTGTQTNQETQTDARFETTLENLRTQTGPSGRTLYDYSARVAQEEGIPHAAVIAMIAVESQGVVQATSETSVVGIMQVTCATTADTLGLQFANTGECNQVRQNPEQSIRAGTRYFADILHTYEGLAHQVAFAAAEYNGGPHIMPLIERLQAQGTQDPSYEEVMQLLTPSYLSERSTQYSSWTPEQRERKVQEITNHGLRVARYYQMAGGSVPPTYVSNQQYGTYEFSLSASAPYDATNRNTLREIQQNTHQLPTQTLQEQYLQSRNMLACGTYAEELSQATQNCQEYFASGCACPIPLPTLDRYAELPQEMLFDPFSATMVYEEEDQYAFFEWLGPAPDDAWSGSFGVREQLLNLPATTQYGPRLQWTQNDPDTFYLLNNQATSITAISAPDGVVWVEHDEMRPALIFTNTPATCEYRVPRNYCSEIGSVWVDIHSEAPEQDNSLGGSLFDLPEEVSSVIP